MVTRIGKYEVESEIGEGGFGRVYRAHDPSVDRHVAIKVLNAQPDPDMLVLFRAEAKTTGNLVHKNIVTVYDFGEHNGVPYLVMELLEGQNFEVAIRTAKAISLIDKLQWLQQAAEGLNYAHQRGVIHRDIKPANIMLLPTGSIKIMDFGIANLATLSNTRQMGRTSITGTPRYMAPEQLTGAPADVQTDIFAFGLVCYECISGNYPFHSVDEGRIVFRTAAAKAAPLNQVCPDCPELLASTVGRALAFDREVRYQSLEDVLFDFQPILLEARRQHALGLMGSVDQLGICNEPDQVRAILKQVLEFDPSHGAARKMLEKLRTDDRKLAQRRSIEERLLQGSARLEARDYSGAIASFEGALRSDGSCEAAQAGLEKARQLLESSRSCARLLSNARYESSLGNFAEAFSLVEQALKADPSNEQALGFRRDVEVSIAVRNSRDMRSRKEFDAAEQVLSELRGFSQHSSVLEEMAAIKFDRAVDLQEQRRKAFETRQASLLQQQDCGNWTAALRVALELRETFPERGNQVAEMILEIREGQAAAKRARAINDTLAEANKRLAENSFILAIDTLEATLQSYPRERALLELRDQARVLMLESEMASAIRAGEFALGEGRETGQWEPALKHLSEACQRHPGVDQLKTMLAEAQTELRQRDELADWHNVTSLVPELLISNPSEAVSLLVAAEQKHGARPAYAPLLRKCQTETEFRTFLDLCLSYIQLRNWRKAGVSLEAAALVDPDRPEIDALATRIVTGQQEERVDHAVSLVRAALESRDLAEARALLKRLAALPCSEARRAELEQELSLWEIAAEHHSCVKCGVIAPQEAKFCDLCGTHLLPKAVPALHLSM